MKTIIIVRHGKAETLKGNSIDLDRRLTARGKRDVEKIAARLLKRRIVPDLIVSSPAARALQTAEGIAVAGNIPTESIVSRRELYDQEDAFLGIIREADNAVRSILITGHNPSVSELAGVLAPEFDGDLPTAGTAVVGFDTDAWEDIAPGEGRLLLMLAPGAKTVGGKIDGTLKERRAALGERLITALGPELAAYSGAKNDDFRGMVEDACRKIARKAIPKGS